MIILDFSKVPSSSDLGSTMQASVLAGKTMTDTISSHLISSSHRHPSQTLICDSGHYGANSWTLYGVTR